MKASQYEKNCFVSFCEPSYEFHKYVSFSYVITLAWICNFEKKAQHLQKWISLTPILSTRYKSSLLLLKGYLFWKLLVSLVIPDSLN
jgi:hypothetical protein